MRELIEKLPYGPSFLFVDEILSVDENAILGTYTFSKDALFYRDHFGKFLDLNCFYFFKFRKNVNLHKTVRTKNG